MSYLFGTMHIKDDRVYQFCDALYPLIQSADVYVGEMDMSSVQADIGAHVYSMKAFFRPEVYQKIKAQLLKSFRLDLDRYAHLHPLMIMSAVSQTILDQDHSVSLDEYLWNYARENNLIVQGLESVEEQISLLHAIDPEPLYVQIRNISSRPAALRKFTDTALGYYLHGDIHRLYQVTKSSMRDLRKRIIYQRNKLMAERIAAFDPSRRYFITVGAGHLSGPTGIISSLRKAGYKVQAVKFTREDSMGQSTIE